MRALVLLLLFVGCSTTPKIEIGMSYYHFHRENKDLRMTWEHPIKFKHPNMSTGYILDGRRVLLISWSDYDTDRRDYHVVQYVIYEAMGVRSNPVDYAE